MATGEKNPRCPFEPESLGCLQVIWGDDNLCAECDWWEEYCDDSDDIPYLAIGDDELGSAVGETAKCPNCRETHDVVYGEQILEDGTRIPSKMLAFVECGKRTYVVGVNGREIG